MGAPDEPGADEKTGAEAAGDPAMPDETRVDVDGADPGATPSADRDSAPVRVLVVDDQPLIRRGLALTLECEPGLSVVGQAADGRQAVDMARALRPDIVLMDLMMPTMGGVAATRAITGEWPDTRVVVLTTYDTDELVFDAIRAGAQAYLLKDAEEAELIETLRAVASGESRLQPEIARRVMQEFGRPPPGDSATGLASSSSPPPSSSPSLPSVPSAPFQSAAAVGAAATSPATPEAPATVSVLAESTGPLGVVMPAGEAPLGAREQQLLGLIAQGLSNKAIAREMALAEGTVKNYTSRIMSKLHARSRTELAVKALQPQTQTPSRRG